MKNYDLVLGDSLKGKDISITEKKVAFLVPNMFNKVASGYDKNCATLVEAKAKKTETQNQEVIAPAPASAPNVPVAPVPPAPVSAPEIKLSEAPVLPPKPELAPPAEEKPAEAPKVEVKPEAPAQPTAPEVKPAEAPVKEKRYAEKVAPMDVIFLRTNKLHANSAPKKLLISVVFKGKLVNHRNKSIAKALCSLIFISLKQTTNNKTFLVSSVTEVLKVSEVVDPKGPILSSYKGIFSTLIIPLPIPS